MSLLLGEMDPNFPGETGLDSSGEVLDCVEEVTPLNIDIPPGNIVPFSGSTGNRLLLGESAAEPCFILRGA